MKVSEKNTAFHDDQNLANLFSAAPEYMTAQDTTGQLEWLVEGFLPLSYLVILGATSKAGKSCLATHLAHAVCTGTDFLGMPTKQVPVLWIAYEENEAERRLILHHYQPVSDKLYISHEKILIDSESGIEALRYWVQKTNAGLVVLDPLYCAVGAESLSDGRKARGALEGMKELCRTENVAALILHHLTKNVDAGLTRERFADSNQILATASMDWIMESRDIENESREIRLHSTGRGAFANKTWVIHSTSESNYTLVDCGSKGDITRCSIEKSIMTFMETTHTGVTAETIAEATGNKVRAVRNTLTTLVRDNQLFVTGKRGKAAIYSAEPPLCTVDSDDLSWM